ncbi:NACHT domain-containing protein [Nannocystis sp. ILAH1]|nr:NACHT domain-containing protein [Nannocystis sp. ILAH1]MCY0995485.1 NACHT domain-containing protein [Nannocystis sp. ILAH1]
MPSPIEDVLKSLKSRGNRLLIRGHAGSGKSTLLRWIALQAAAFDVGSVEANKDNWRTLIPLLIRLRDLSEFVLSTPESLVNVTSSGLGSPSPEWVEDSLSSGCAMVLLDGIDEIPLERRDDAKGGIASILRQFPDSCYLVSTRPEAVPFRWLEDLGFQEAWINPLSDPDKAVFVKKWHDAVSLELQRQGRNDPRISNLCDELLMRLPEHPIVNRLAYNPLLCAMICALHRDRHKRLPQSQSDLCESLCQMLLERRESESGLDLSGFPQIYVQLSYAQRRAIVQELAHYLVRNGTSSIDDTTAEQRVQAVLERFGSSSKIIQEDSSRLLHMLVERSGMLREQRPGVIDFVHNTFKEYLAAEKFAQDNDYGVLSKHCMDGAWIPVLIFAAAHPNARFASKLIEQILEDVEQDINVDSLRARKLLAVRLRAASTELQPEMHKKVDRLVKDLFPPQAVSVAEEFAEIGNIAIPHLRYSDKWSANEAAASVRTLRLIGTPDARSTMLIGYPTDERIEVVSELLQAESIRPFQVQLIRNTLVKGEPLPAEIASQIVDIERLTADVGPIQVLDLTGTRILSFAPLRQMTELRELKLSQGRIELTELRFLEKLISLTLEDMTVSDLYALGDLPNLRTLRIRNSRILDSEQFEEISLLEELDLSGSSWTSDDAFFGRLRNLVSLNLQNTTFSGLGSIKSIKKLRSLNLSGTLVGSVSSLKSLRHLRRLDVSNTDVTDHEVLERLDDCVTGRTGGFEMLDIQKLEGQVSVVIVTVRDDEFAAVCNVFQAKTTIFGGKNIYRYASMLTSQGLIGVAICRCVEQGESKAQTVTGHAIDDFLPKPPQWIVLAGIAGGFPDTDFTLGDVVVSNRLHDFSISAALSKASFESYGRGGPMDRDVEAVLAWMPTLIEMIDWSKYPGVAKTRPREEIGQKADDEKLYGSKDWKIRVHRALYSQLGRGRCRKLPKIWIAPNVSGNVLLKDPTLARQWRSCARAAASVEMELAGAYEAVHDRRHCSRIVGVRGISDIVGYKRTSEWLAHACQTAACVTHALVASGILQLVASGTVR